MTLKEFRELTKDNPDNTKLEIAVEKSSFHSFHEVRVIEYIIQPKPLIILVAGKEIE